MIVLGLHRFCDSFSDYPYETTPEFLASVFDELGHSNYLALDSVLDPYPNSWTLTVDDGFATDYALAKWLSDRNVTAAFFIVPNWVGQPERLSWEQVREISDMGHTVGSHSLNHDNLTNLDFRSLSLDLSQSKSILEDQVGKNVNWLAYPWGRSNRLVRQVAAANSFVGALGVTPLSVGIRSPRFSLPRLALTQDSRLEDIKQVQKGAETDQFRTALASGSNENTRSSPLEIEVE